MSIKRLNVLQIQHAGATGDVGRHVLSLSSGLRSLGHQVCLALRPNAWLHDCAEQAGLEVVTLALRGVFDPNAYWTLYKLARARQFDVIHAHCNRGAMYGAIVARLAQSTSMCTVHMLDSLKGLYRQQKLVATSDAIYSDLILRGLSPTRISRIDSGVACFPPITIYERARSRNRLGIRKEEVALALQGRMSSPADYGLLLRALSSLGDAGDRFRLYIIEPQDLDDAYHIIRLADKAGLLDQLTLCGYRDDVISVIKGMDVVVHISQTDKAALPILEAMSLAIPVVASRTDGIPELIEHGYNGLLFSSGCQAELASCLRSLADPALRQALGQAARATQQHRFTIDAMVRSTVALYRPGLSG